MTNKRKIQILKKVIKNLGNNPRYYGICYWAYRELTTSEREKHWQDLSTEQKLNQFKINPTAFSEISYFYYPQTNKGNQQRINACKRAIKKLEQK